MHILQTYKKKKAQFHEVIPSVREAHHMPDIGVHDQYVKNAVD